MVNESGVTEPTPAERTFIDTNAKSIIPLLEAGKYEQIVQLLHKAQQTEAPTSDPVLDNLLSAAYQICVTCVQYHTEVSSSRCAYERAVDREEALRRQLQELLLLIDQHTATAPDKPQKLSSPPLIDNSSPSQNDQMATENRSFLQRIKDLLDWNSSSGAFAKENSPALGNSDSSSLFVADGPSISASDTPGEGDALPEFGREAPVKPPQVVNPEAETPAADLGDAPRGPMLSVYCLGSFRVYDDEQLIEKWVGNKCKSIFKYLVINRERPVHREILMDLFWRDDDPEAARRNLYQAIYMLRQTLQTDGSDFDYILCEDSCYSLNPALNLWVDSEVFRRYYQQGQELERQERLPEAMKEYEAADSLYEGEFLAEDVYEDWLLVHRENLKHAHFDILDRLSQYYYRQGQFAMSIAYCLKILGEDNCREDAHRRLMRAYLQQGQRPLALRQYHRCVKALEQELDVSPMPATTKLYRQIQNNAVQFSDRKNLRGN